MSAIKGTVQQTYEKEWNGQDGKVILHSFQLQGDKRYFRTGTSKLVGARDTISFDVEGNNNVLESSLTKLEREVQTAPAPQGNSYGSAGGRPSSWGGGAAKAKSTENFEARQQYWTNKEQRDIEVVEPRITWSASRSAAIEVIGLALQHDALAFGNASKGAKLGLILDYVDEVAARFYHQSMNAAESADEAQAKADAKGSAKASKKETATSDND